VNANRWRKGLGTSGWYLLLIAVMLVTAIPFLWAALMSVRETSASPFPRNRPAQIVPYAGLIGWGEGAREARASGEYRGDDGWWTDYGPANRERLEGSALEPYAFAATTENYVRVAQDILLIAVGTGMVVDAVDNMSWEFGY